MKIQIGEVTHYFGNIGVAVLKLRDKLEVGDRIYFQGHTTDFDQIVTSMEIDHQPVTSVKPGDDFALKVHQKVRNGDTVYKET
jgi:translation elongation factor EF-1alpha